MSGDARVPFFKEVVLLIIGGLLTVGGTLLGVYLNNKNEREEWERRAQFQLDQSILDQRVKLAERTAKILNQVDLLELNYLVEGGKATLAKHGQGELEDIIVYRKAVAELNSEFFAVSSLNNMYFGPEVKEASRNILAATGDEVHWWQVSSDLRQKYLDAISGEMGYGLKKRK